MPTIREELAAGIESRGGALIEKGKKRWKFSHPRDADRFYYLGVSGGLRVGGTVEHSIGLTGTHVYNVLRKEGSQRLTTNT